MTLASSRLRSQAEHDGENSGTGQDPAQFQPGGPQRHQDDDDNTDPLGDLDGGAQLAQSAAHQAMLSQPDAAQSTLGHPAAGPGWSAAG
ncbi:hypothetical protein GCM10022631_24840 [Deinococcus rubellus]|uniref:hypothetical protein n=1 Tax=Deinococcus rubellus TaxID=1889240 RepID=UPI0031E791F1